MLFYILLLSLNYCDSKTIWNKFYITWSVENGSNQSFIDAAVQMWNVEPIKLEKVLPGKGDLKIVFKNLNKNRANFSKLLGQAFAPNNPQWGQIYIDKNLDKATMFYVIQHEIGHALGLKHSNNSVMERFFSAAKNVSAADRKKIFKKYNCSFDSVTLLNYQTYLVFQGSYYKRFDYNTQQATKNKLWFSSRIKYVDAMYRNSFGNYMIISNDTFYELDTNLRWIQSGKLNDLFPKLKKVNAVLTLRNGSTMVISKKKIYNIGRLKNIFTPIVPKKPVKGAYQELNGNIVLVDKFYRWIYDKNFKFLYKENLCKIKIHCCLIK